jgi:hypothetical protein
MAPVVDGIGALFAAVAAGTMAQLRAGLTRALSDAGLRLGSYRAAGCATHSTGAIIPRPAHGRVERKSITDRSNDTNLEAHTDCRLSKHQRIRDGRSSLHPPWLAAISDLAIAHEGDHNEVWDSDA